MNFTGTVMPGLKFGDPLVIYVETDGFTGRAECNGDRKTYVSEAYN
jgi:hypothetical protein